MKSDVAIKALKNDCMLGIWSDSSIEAIQYLEQLEKENRELKEINEQLEGCNKEVSVYAYQLAMEKQVLKEENEKLNQAIKILKDNFPIKFLGYNKYGAKPYEIMIHGYIMGFDKEQYELLIKFFESEGNGGK